MKQRIVRRLLIGTALIAGFVIVYGLYGRAAWWMRGAEYRRDAVGLRGAAPLEIRQRGDWKIVDVGGRLVVRGRTSARDELSSLDWIGPPRRLDDLALRMGFRVRDRSPYDLMVGLETAEANPARRREIRFGLANGAQPVYRLFGDPAPSGMRLAGDRDLSTARTPVVSPEAWHTIEMRFAPDLHSVVLMIDGRPQGSRFVGWERGTPVRLVFGVAGREPNEPVDLEIADARAEWMPAEEPRALVDRFAAGRFEMARWRLLALDPFAFRADDGALGLSGDSELVIAGPVFDARSFSFSVRLATRALVDCSLEIGVTNLAGVRRWLGVEEAALLPRWRSFVVGHFARADEAGDFLAGHWQGNGQLGREKIARPLGGEEEELAIAVDARAHTATAWVGGRRIARERVDLQPGERVVVYLAVRRIGVAPRWSTVLRELRFQPLDMR